MKILFITENLEGRSGWSRYSLDLTNSLEEKGIEVDVCKIEKPLSFKKHFYGAPFFAIRYYLKYRKSNIDVIHCAVEPYAFIALLLSLLLRKPFILTMHGTYSIKLFSYSKYRKIQAFAYSRASKIVAVSTYTKNKLLKYCPDLNIEVIANGIKPSAPDEHRLHSESQKNLILTVAPFKKRKGLHVVAKALPNVFKNIPTARWIVVGKSEDQHYEKEVINILRDEDILDRCDFHKNISDEKLHELYGCSRVFVLIPQSSEFEFEGFGLVYLEANSFGVPTIGGLSSGAEEAISNGKSGFLIPPTDHEQLSKLIVKMFEDEDMYRQISLGALNWVNDHEISKIADIYISCYKDLVIK
jgi:phosphatidyl-myo-inositol dimannoside synthase